MATLKQGRSSTSCRSVATWSGLSVVVGGLATSGVSVAFVSHAASAYPPIGEHPQYEHSDSKGFLSPATGAPSTGSHVSPAGILAACGVAATVAGGLRRSGARSSGRSAMQASKAKAKAAADKKLAASGSMAASEAPEVSWKKLPVKAAPMKQPPVERGDVGKEYAGQIGDTLPFRYWDPLGLAANGDDVDFRRRRMAEIKNGRVAMIASMGYIAPEFFRWPGYCSPSMQLKFTDIPNGVGALYKVPTEGWAQIGVFIGFLELFPMRQENNRVAGDFATCGRLGVPWFFILGRNGSVCNPDASKRSLDSELNNGRLAMVAITGMILQNGFTGTTGAEMWIPPA